MSVSTSEVLHVLFRQTVLLWGNGLARASSNTSMTRSVALIAVLLAAVATAATPPKPSLAVRRTGVVENCGGRSMLVSAKVLVRD